MNRTFHVILFTILILGVTTNLAQTNNYFKAILDNGYAWISLCEPLSISTDNRYNYLVSLLGNQKLKKLSKSNYSLIDCEDDISNLDKSLPQVNRIDLNFMVKMIDKFYDNKEKKAENRQQFFIEKKDFRLNKNKHSGYPKLRK